MDEDSLKELKLMMLTEHPAVLNTVWFYSTPSGCAQHRPAVLSTVHVYGYSQCSPLGGTALSIVTVFFRPVSRVKSEHRTEKGNCKYLVNG